MTATSPPTGGMFTAIASVNFDSTPDVKVNVSANTYSPLFSKAFLDKTKLNEVVVIVELLFSLSKDLTVDDSDMDERSSEG